MRIEERDGDYVEPDAIRVRIGNKWSGTEMADWLLRGLENYFTDNGQSMMVRSQYVGMYEKSCPFPAIANEGPVIAELLRADQVGDTAMEIWSVGGQPFVTYRDVRDWRCHKGDPIGEITVGGKAIPIYQVRKRLI